MRLNRIFLFMLMLGLTVSASAQTKARGKAKAKAVVVDPRLEQQLQAVEKVTFIDSIVVPQKQLYQYINLGTEAGRVMPAAQFLGISDSLDCSLYESQMHNIIIYARRKGGSALLQLVQSDSIIGTWTKPMPLNGLNPDDSQNYPFLMPDGQTLYFAAQGTESLGGYDIFMTRYDADTKTWLTPQSIGMPFNSTANDYLYMIDEYNQLGYFVTDRHQKAGQVCIYTFIPRESRNIYDPDSTPHDSLQTFADIHRIADTWTNQKEVAAALDRKTQLENSSQRKAVQRNFEFVVNDRLTYTNLSQFRNADARKQAQFWLETKAQLKKVEDKLATLRNQYHSNKAKRESLKPTILEVETQVEKITSDLIIQEKNIRALEGN